MVSISPSDQSSSTLWGPAKMKESIEGAAEKRNAAIEAATGAAGMVSAAVSESLEAGTIDALGTKQGAFNVDQGKDAQLAQVGYDLFRGLKALWGLMRGGRAEMAPPRQAAGTGGAVPATGPTPAAVPGQPATGTGAPGTILGKVPLQ